MNNVWQNSGTNECPIHPVALSQSLLTVVLAKPLPALFFNRIRVCLSGEPGKTMPYNELDNESEC